ncbi:hypothetical protein M758_7G088900 [Ceratodon purpureus]|nr:hypothetical protein M758_7G088900 [Ceratodon purpureus]
MCVAGGAYVFCELVLSCGLLLPIWNLGVYLGGSAGFRSVGVAVVLLWGFWGDFLFVGWELGHRSGVGVEVLDVPGVCFFCFSIGVGLLSVAFRFAVFFWIGSVT